MKDDVDMLRIWAGVIRLVIVLECGFCIYIAILRRLEFADLHRYLWHLLIYLRPAFRLDFNIQVKMDFKERIYILIVLFVSWKSADASTVLTDVSTIVNNPLIKGNNGGHEQLCTACEAFTAKATTFLKENKTQSEILDALHYACSQLYSLEVKCGLVVDYYSAIFFAAVGKIQPEEFCGKVGLCEKQFISIVKNDDTCALCRRVVAEVLVKLKDPVEQLEIVQMLFKECDKMEKYAQECKQLVVQYGPYILIKGEKFFEKNDVCASIHACSANQHEAIIVSALLGSSTHDT